MFVVYAGNTVALVRTKVRIEDMRTPVSMLISIFLISPH